MATRGQRADSGFSLIELMSVVAILGVLVAIAVPLYRGIAARAVDAVLAENVHVLETKVRLVLQQDRLDLRFRTNPRRHSPDTFLSTRLQADLEAEDITVADTTIDPIANPVSDNDNVLLRGSPNTNRHPTPPGVFITGSRSFRHERVRQNERRLAGSIVILIDRRRDRVEIYSMDADGLPSDDVEIVEVTR